MKSILGALVLVVGMCVEPAWSADHGFPVLNAAGRYLGVGWSHHTYHSNTSGRFPLMERRHPTTNYPSRYLSYPYAPQPVFAGPLSSVSGIGIGTSPAQTSSMIASTEGEPTVAPSMSAKLPRVQRSVVRRPVMAAESSEKLSADAERKSVLPIPGIAKPFRGGYQSSAAVNRYQSR